MSYRSTPTPQPAKAMIVLAAKTITGVAREIPCSPHFLGRILNGYVPPTPRIRRRLGEILDKPEADLFVDGRVPEAVAS